MKASSIFTAEPSEIVVTCAPCTSNVLASEIATLGFDVSQVQDAAVTTSGTLADCMRLNLHLRTAHRVLYALDRFSARNCDDLYDHILDIPWERYLDPDGFFSVDRSVSNVPSIRNTQIAALKVKDAIADRMRNACGRRPNSGNDRTDACLFLYWVGQTASIYIDTTGVSLSFRGYRSISAEAPLRESLAAALILSSGWNRQGPFLTPMCGGGTLAIEALWIAQNRPPALLRENFAFQHLACFEPRLWTDLRADAMRKFEQTRNINLKVFASDIDPAMVHATRVNAKIAEVSEFIETEVCDVALATHPATDIPGVAILNPPYGARLGDPATLGLLYEAVGAFLTDAARDGYQGFLFTGNPDICDHIGLLYSKATQYYSGAMECYFLEDPQLSPTALRRFKKRQH